MSTAVIASKEIEQAVLSDLLHMSYEDVSRLHNWSRGKIYSLALKHGARKTETRIRERAAERRERQLECLKEMVGTTAKANVLDYLDSLPKGCASAVITSTPYNLGIKYGENPEADSLAFTSYIGWIMQILSEASRILKEGGVLFLQVGSTRDETGNLAPLDILLFDTIKRIGLTFQSRVIWTIPHGLTPKGRLSERHETALVFSKGPMLVFNPTPARQPQKQPGKRAFKGPSKGKISSCYFGGHPSNVWSDIPNVRHGHPEKTGHPAQFPLELARRAILLYTMPGDLIVDPFSGSGTTHVAAVQTGRTFTGCDLFYEEIRAQRLAKAFPDLVSKLPGVTDETVAVWNAEARRVGLDVRKSKLTPVDQFKLL